MVSLSLSYIRLSFCIAGLDKIRDEFTSWEWRFGKTPKFTVTKSFPIFDDPAEKVNGHNLKVTLKVEKGMIADVSYQLPENKTGSVSPCCRDLLSNLYGKKFSSQTFDLIEKSLSFDEKKENMKTALRA